MTSQRYIKGNDWSLKQSVHNMISKLNTIGKSLRQTTRLNPLAVVFSLPVGKARSAAHALDTLYKPVQLCLLLTAGLFSATTLAMPQQSLVPGGIAIIQLDSKAGEPKFSFRNKPVLISRQQDQTLAVVGLPLSLKPGEYFISGHYADNKQLVKKFFSVRHKEYSTQHITIKDKRKVNPIQQDMERIIPEQKRKKIAASFYSEEIPDLEFLTPVEGIISGSYGRRRVFNGQPKRPHSGMDIAAPRGRAILSPADGTVIESGDFFFSGNLLYIHHGQGLISLYAHLDEIKVQPGERVLKGQQIGTVGTTGRVTGPHLHWSVGLNGSWVDPALFIKQAEPDVAKSN
jgi:murein DD-endopeptidase MepM/ murein hydrolase activator NlpD